MGTEAKPCDGVLGQQFRPDPADCRVYYLCGQGKDWRLQCGPNTVWSQEIGACVPVGSPEDTCTQSNKDPLPYTAPKGDPAARSPGSRHYSPFSESTWRPKCTPGSTKRFPHPSRCAQYYDCGGDPKEDWWGKHLRECPYPTVYDTTTGSCEYYTTVNCGQRKMPLDPCDYLAHSCRNAHCSPCHIRYATCSGLPDGINVWRGREKTPFYVVCQAQRVAFHGRCINPEPGKRQIYDGEYHTCGRPVDFEMGMVHHMHRGEIGKSQIVKQINHAKRVGKAEKRPKASMGKNNPAQQSAKEPNTKTTPHSTTTTTIFTSQPTETAVLSPCTPTSPPCTTKTAGASCSGARPQRTKSRPPPKYATNHTEAEHTTIISSTTIRNSKPTAHRSSASAATKNVSSASSKSA
uniref:Chitin-binding type-2 domain-containing protein n=1 Tax=Magallana gigas TaxID=29159 RepID=K1RBC3_MAGGI